MLRLKKLHPCSGALILLTCFLASCEPDLPYPDNPAATLSGTWYCQETSDKLPPAAYQVSISAVPGEANAIYIDNFYQIGAGRKVKARIEGYYLSIPVQEVNGFTFSGSGNINNNFDQISLTYSADDQSELNNVQNTLLKR